MVLDAFDELTLVFVAQFCNGKKVPKLWVMTLKLRPFRQGLAAEGLIERMSRSSKARLGRGKQPVLSARALALSVEIASSKAPHLMQARYAGKSESPLTQA